MKQQLSDKDPIEIEKDIYWLGFADFEGGFSNNAYLIKAGKESILIDPGPGYPLYRDIFINKLQKVCNLDDIRYILVHHQDPDLCGIIPYIENDLNPNLLILAHSRTALFLPYYGIKKPISHLFDGDILILNNKRKLHCIHTPYIHFAGSTMTYDEETKSLFSSDVFAVLERNWDLFANKEYLSKAKLFLEFYVESKEAVIFTYEKLKRFEIRTIFPQHGGIIKNELVKEFLELLPDLEPGKLIRTKLNLESNILEENDNLYEDIKNFFESLTNKYYKFESLENAIEILSKQNTSQLIQFLDYLKELEEKLGITILKSKEKIHNYNSLKERSYSGIIIFNNVWNRLQNKNQNLSTQKLIILFFDIRNFTKWSENQSSQEIFKILNQELEIVSSIIQEYNGRINKLLGDGILAYFTIDRLENSYYAAVKIHNQIYKKNLLPAGISLEWGIVSLGNIGIKEKFDFTILGSAVNRASRLNDIAKKGEIIMGKNLFNNLNSTIKKKIQNNPYFKEGEYQAKKGEVPIPYIQFKVIRYKN